MNDMIPWIAAEAGPPEIDMDAEFPEPGKERSPTGEEVGALPAHQFPTSPRKEEALPATEADAEAPPMRELEQPEPCAQAAAEAWERFDLRDDDERERRKYRGRTVAMLRRYLRYSIECGRVPSLLGAEFFRTRVTAYTVVTFEDRVIFVHDMETCLEKLDEFSRQLIARHVLQEHDQFATSRLLHCSERTVRTYVPIALDLLGEILLEKGLLDRSGSNSKKSCQGGLEDENSVSDCEHGKNNF